MCHARAKDALQPVVRRRHPRQTAADDGGGGRNGGSSSSGDSSSNGSSSSSSSHPLLQELAKLAVSGAGSGIGSDRAQRAHLGVGVYLTDGS